MSNKMWGGRFASGPAEIMEEINASIAFDQKLFAQDIAGSKAHARMLAKQAIISKADAKAILKGLDQVEVEIKSGKFKFSRALEDIHMNVESRLKDLIGAPAGRLHTGRSRNDQVAVDFRLYVRDAADHLQEAVRELQRVLVKQASAHSASIMPGFTHLQTAQPITFGHHLLAYVEMLERDYGRFADARARMNESPLGAAALAGTVYPIDRKMTASELGFARPMRNSLDAVSDRDFALEMLAASSICAIHLSRLAEEIVLWMTAQFGFVKLSDQFTTGSSIMPQKRNPDAAELIRAKPGRILGSFVALAGVMKGLPLTYSKDMQEDKEPVFDALSNLSLAIAAMTGMIKDMKPDLARMRQAAERGFANATDLADWLVQKLGLPFREAHHVTGALVALAEQKGTGLEGLSLADMQKIHKAIHADVFKAITIEASVNARKSYGGTAPAQVRKQVEFWRKKLSSGTKLGYKK